MKPEIREAIEYGIKAIEHRIRSIPKKRPDRNQFWERAWAHRHKTELQALIASEPSPEDHSSDCATIQHPKSECTCGVKDRLRAQEQNKS